MTPENGNSGKGKRKADEVDGSPEGTPPDVKKQQRATFAADPRPHRASGTSSHAPSSYTRKRAKLSAAASTSAAGLAAAMASVGENDSRNSKPPSRSNSRQSQNAATTGTWTSSKSRNGVNIDIPARTQSRASHRSQRQSVRAPSRASALNPSHMHNQDATPSRAPSRHSRRGSISAASIPISALISPHAPSISHRSTPYHMRDPHKPPRVQPTPWSLSFPEAGPGEEDYLRGRLKSMARSIGSNSALKSLKGKFRTKDAGNDGDEDDKQHYDDREPGSSSPIGWIEGGGSPLHAWLFFAGFILFPIWWIAGFLVRIPKTRRIDPGRRGEKAVVLDDPQVEHDAKSWRFRCRIMALVSLITYVPFIVLVAIFAPRS
ncbi:hypothetical protein K435DRAFT_817146 [Dendrothele bispora CBS 962.96]|uniref:Uncharacterized protein n=1 Tax=Dendrothele bispora (strain CBS 962.96) TaxID=1314807 RepID=A0A4V6T5N0_DENBC|nr:hypothetical protein K435DRAFT_817146 [Dendrothele bispora CBS 962.96]